MFNVNFSNINPLNKNGSQVQYAEQKRQKHCAANLRGKNVSFGDEYYSDHPLKDGLLSLTNGFLGIIGFNAALWWIQNFVNGKILVGKINKHFTKNLDNPEQLEQLALEMRDKEGLSDVDIKSGNPGEAFYTETGIPERRIRPNSIRVGEDQVSSLFHELGHAKIENKTEILKFLQRRRGNYAVLALALYALMSQGQNQRRSDVFGDERKSFGAKVKDFFTRSTLIVPLLAFSPELITEAMASKYGLKFLKEVKNAGRIDKKTFRNIKRSYITCFGTYLFIPVSIILMELLFSGIEKEINKHKSSQY